MKVQMYRQRPAGAESIGTIHLRDGVLVPEPAESVPLLNVLGETIRLYGTDGAITLLDAKLQPEAFLKALPTEYHGTYFWAGPVEEE